MGSPAPHRTSFAKEFGIFPAVSNGEPRRPWFLSLTSDRAYSDLEKNPLKEPH